MLPISLTLALSAQRKTLENAQTDSVKKGAKEARRNHKNPTWKKNTSTINSLCFCRCFCCCLRSHKQNTSTHTHTYVHACICKNPKCCHLKCLWNNGNALSSVLFLLFVVAAHSLPPTQTAFRLRAFCNTALTAQLECLSRPPFSLCHITLTPSPSISLCRTYCISLRTVIRELHKEMLCFRKLNAAIFTHTQTDSHLHAHTHTHSHLCLSVYARK